MTTQSFDLGMAQSSNSIAPQIYKKKEASSMEVMCLDLNLT